MTDPVITAPAAPEPTPAAPEPGDTTLLTLSCGDQISVAAPAATEHHCPTHGLHSVVARAEIRKEV